MSIANYIKEIGRGGQGARSLTSDQARDLMCQVLDGKASDLEVGAFALAMRMKGETVAELSGFLDATHARCLQLSVDRPVILLPSYNGARRLPNLTALLAMRLAQEGALVLVHGPGQDPSRVTTAEIFRDLGLSVSRHAADVEHAWSRREPAFLRTDVLCPPLARLLDVRWVVGLRNSGHTVAKMLNPCVGARALRVVNHTHPEFGQLMSQFAEVAHADMLLLRGTEGEPVADPRRSPRMQVMVGGQPRTDLSALAQDGVLTELPVLPRTHDASTTALYIQSVISGEKPTPPPIDQQVTALMKTVAAMVQHDAVGLTA